MKARYLFGCLLLSAFARGALAAPAGLEVVRFGIAAPATGSPPSIGGSSVALAHARGTLAKTLAHHGIKLEWIFFKGAGPAVNEAIANRRLDFAWQGDFPSILGKANGLDTRLIMAGGVRQNVYLAAKPGAAITRIADLRGKRVALFKGTNLQLAVGKLLAAHGLAERDIRFVNLDNPNAHAALVAGDLDAVFGSHELLDLEHRGLAKVVYDSKGDDLQYRKHTHVLVTTAFAKAHPEVVKLVVKGLLEAARWVSDEANREEVLRLWARAGVPYEAWKRDLAGVPLRVQASPHFDGFLTAHYKESVAAALRLKLIRRDLDVDAWIDRGFLTAVLAELGWQEVWPAFDPQGRAIAQR